MNIISTLNNKFNIGDKIRTHINYSNDRRKEIDAIIKDVIKNFNDQIQYEIDFEPDDIDIENGCLVCTGYINELNIIKKY